MCSQIMPYDVPYVCQFASPDLVRELIGGQLPLEHDPRWPEYGADSPAEYAHWSLRACGVVCLKMAADALSGEPPRPVMAWVREGLALDGYLTELRPDRPDRPVEKGWKHAALVDLARAHGLQAEAAADLDLAAITGHLAAGRLVITSVSSELGEPGPITRRSGHLVVVIGVHLAADRQVSALIIHNPSGRTLELQAGAVIPAGRFLQAFSGRGIIIGTGRNTDTIPRPAARL
ncbi:MAG: C39 family peptidase [Anaerolineae bacterium]